MSNTMKKSFSFFLAALLILGLAACGNHAGTEPAESRTPAGSATEAASGETASMPENAENGSSESTGTPEASGEAGTVPSSGDEEDQSRTLVVYFSATGTTKGVAEKIAALTGGDLYEIVPAEPYSNADLNWNDRSSRSTREQNDKSARPGIGSERIDLTGYTTIYIGFPIWWGEEPRIMDTFVESYRFDGMTMIPFCTSSSSGIGRSGSNMEALAGSGTWLDGKRFGGNVSQADLQSWIDGLR